MTYILQQAQKQFHLVFDLDGEKIIIIREDQSDGFTESETCSVVHEIDDDKKKKKKEVSHHL